MDDLISQAGSVCGVLVFTGLLSGFCEEEKLISVVRGLAILTVLVSLLFSLFHADFPALSTETEVEDRTGAVTQLIWEEQLCAAEEQYTTYLQGLLGTIGLHAEKIALNISKFEEDSIVLEQVELWFSYQSEAERARALVSSVLEGVEVMVHGTA